MLIDPPSGWKYGFPKPAPEFSFRDLRFVGYDTLLKQWLIDQGYPGEKVDEAVKYMRYIGTQDQIESIADGREETTKK